MNQISTVPFLRTHKKMVTRLFLVGVYAVIYLIADYHGIFRRITAYSDQDIILAYNALLFNEGLPQQYFDHTGYVYFLILSTWLKALHVLGLLPISSLGELTYSQSSYGDLEQVIFAGRYLSIVLSSLLATVLFFGMRRFTGSSLIAGMVTLTFVISPGLSFQVLMMRTELPAFLFVLTAFFLGVTPPGKPSYSGHWMLFGTAFFATLGMMTKVQIVPFAVAFPILFLIFTFFDQRPEKKSAGWESPRNPELAAIALFAVSVPAQLMIWSQVFLPGVEKSTIGGWYQVMVALTVIGATVFYSVFLRLKINQVFLRLAIVCSGISVAVYFNFFYHNVENTYILANFFEHMSNFTGLNRLNIYSGGESVQWLVNRFGNGLLYAIERNFDVTRISDRPFVLLYWFVLVGGGGALIRRDNKIAAISFGLLILTIGMESFTFLRGAGDYYRIFNEVWVLIAAGKIVACSNIPVNRPVYLKRLTTKTMAVGFMFTVLTITAGFSANIALKTRAEQPETNACKQVSRLRQPYKDLFCRLNK